MTSKDPKMAKDGNDDEERSGTTAVPSGRVVGPRHVWRSASAPVPPPSRGRSSPRPAPRPKSPLPVLFDETAGAPGRVTLDFSGPLLPLPAERGAEASPVLAGEDVVGVVVPEETPIAAEPVDGGRVEESASREASPDLLHDAWTDDRRRRSTPPPVLGVKDIPVGVRHAKKSTRPPSASGGTEPLAEEATQPSVRGGALDLVEHARPITAELDLESEMEERYALGDFTGALRAAELLLGQRPNDPDATRFAKSSRLRLEQFYSARIGALTRVVRVALPDRNIRWLGLDHRAGFLLSRIDGEHTIEELFDVSGMPRLETLKTLCELLDVKAIRLEG